MKHSQRSEIIVRELLGALKCITSNDKYQQVINSLKTSEQFQSTFYKFLSFEELEQIGIYLHTHKMKMNAFSSFPTLIQSFFSRSSSRSKPLFPIDTKLKSQSLKWVDLFNSSHCPIPRHLYRKLNDILDWQPSSNPRSIFTPMDNILINGFDTPEKVESYVKKLYPCGKARHSGTLPNEENILNYTWSSFERQTKGHQNAIAPQVNDELEEIEDEFVTIDIQIVRNSNVLRLINQGHRPPMESQMFFNEFSEIYGIQGGILFQLALDNDAIFQRFARRVRDRAIQLQQKKMSMMGPLSKRLEKVLPTQRAKYHKADPRSSTVLLTLGRTEIRYSLEDLEVVGEFPAIYQECQLSINNVKNPIDLSNSAPIAAKILTELRNDGTYLCSFPYAVAMLSAAKFASFLSKAGVTKSEKSKSLSIAKEVGLTSDELHGRAKVLRIIAKAAINRSWKNSTQALSGMYPHLTVESCLDMVCIAQMFLKMLVFNASGNGMDPVMFKCVVDGGTIIAYQMDGITPVRFDMSNFEPNDYTFKG